MEHRAVANCDCFLQYFAKRNSLKRIKLIFQRGDLTVRVIFFRKELSSLALHGRQHPGPTDPMRRCHRLKRGYRLSVRFHQRRAKHVGDRSLMVILYQRCYEQKVLRKERQARFQKEHQRISLSLYSPNYRRVLPTRHSRCSCSPLSLLARLSVMP